MHETKSHFFFTLALSLSRSALQRPVLGLRRFRKSHGGSIFPARDGGVLPHLEPLPLVAAPLAEARGRRAALGGRRPRHACAHVLRPRLQRRRV